MKVRKYAGIGPRKTPYEILDKMISLSALLNSLGYTLVSGAAAGADTAFELGCLFNTELKQIFTHHHATEQAMELASRYHPNWAACNENARRQHGRNAMLILGEDLESPVEFVLTWTPHENQGGTAMGIKIAKNHGIPVYNIHSMGIVDVIVNIRNAL